jgi:hypothetical protein
LFKAVRDLGCEDDPGAFDKVLEKITKAPQTHAQRGAQSHHPVTSQLSKVLAAPILSCGSLCSQR